MSKRVKAKKSDATPEGLKTAAVFHNPADSEVIPSLDKVEELSYAVAKKEADAIDEVMQSLMPEHLWEMLKSPDPKVRKTAIHSLKFYKFEIRQFPVSPDGVKRTEIWKDNRLAKVITFKYQLNS